MLFKEIIAVYFENYMRTINISYVQNAEVQIIKTRGTYLWVLMYHLL
jgi:hypothetical protein